MAAKARKTNKYIPDRINYIMEDASEVWRLIENNLNPIDYLKEYQRPGEDKLIKQLDVNEQWQYCKGNYSNYIITSLGRVGTIVSGKFVKCYLRNPETITVYMNGKHNVKVELLMQEAGYIYNPAKIIRYLNTNNLLNE